MRRSIAIIIASLSFVATCAEGESPKRDIVQPFKQWKDVEEAELKPFKAPSGERFELKNGMIVFLLEDHELPLIELSMMLRTGEVYEPPDKAGLAEATATVMRTGGSAKYPGDKLDEILEDMAASVGVGIGSESGSAHLSTLKNDFDKGLAILADVLRHPEFPDDKIDLYLSQARTDISKRNDSPNSIAGREFRKALYGEDSPWARVPEYATLNKIDRKAMQEFHQKWFHPNMIITGVVGDFKKEEMLAKLNAAFGDWDPEKVAMPPIPPIPTAHKHRVLFVDRPKINQTTITMGHVVDMRRDNKDYAAMQLMNVILSGGMSARMFTEVRTRKGLAYAVYGSAGINYDRPGVFNATALTRGEQALEAVDAVKEEVVKLRDGGVKESELIAAREWVVNSFVFNFDSPSKIIGRQLTYEYYHYPMDFAEKLLESVKRVTVEDVNAVARKYLDPDKFVLLGVGNGATADPAKSFRALKDVQLIDVTIPLPPAQPMVIDPKREEQGKRILADGLKAAGGVDAFRKIETVRADLILGMKGMHLKGSMRARFPDNFRVDVAGPFGPVSQIMNKDAAWKASGRSVQELKPADARKNLRTLIQSDLGLMRVLASAQEGYNVQALDPARDGERELLGAEIESQSLGRIKIWFDAQTKLLAKIRLAAEGMQKPHDKVFSGHTRFGDMTLARIVEDKDPLDPLTVELKAVDVNPNLDPALFNRPERASAPPKE